ncbi:MAG: exo-beta-N-acetylmuramidase NamZ family protein [Myxococcaceae bacterium]
MAVRTGLEVWAAQGFRALRGKRVGAIVNPTSVDPSFRHLADLLGAADGVELKALFGPEHGIRGAAQYMVAVGEGLDPHTGVPVHSLYGSTFESLSPRPEWLEGLDALVFDIQDVGSRYYTYVYTMALAMKVAAAAEVCFYVLDRPNPIGGVEVEGNLPATGFRSFVGLYELPNRHGMTAGELAGLFNAEEGFGCDLQVVRCEGWRRAQHFEETGLHFVPPSPNMPTPATALVYPGMCLLEGTNLSEGRGTCRPFEQFGAPWLDGHALAGRLVREGLPGVGFRPVAFTPTFDKHAGAQCQGAMLHVTDRAAFRPLRTAIAAVQAARELAPERFAWRQDAYEFVDQVPAFDLLCGTDQVRRGIEAGWPLDRLVEGFEAQAARFLSRKSRYQLYE